MNNPTQQSSPSAPSEASTSGNGVAVVRIPSLEERSNAAFDIASADAAGEPGTSPTDSTAGAAGVDEATAARAARRATYEKLQAEERQRVDAQAKHREHDALRKRLDEAERRAEASKDHVDPSKLDETAFFEMATKLNVTPQKLGEWLRERMTNPELAAAQAATRVVDPKLSEMRQQLEAQQKVINDFMSNQATQREQAEERHYTEQFHAFTRENTATSPYASRFLELHGPEEYARIATAAAGNVPEGAGAQAILDEVEDRLARLAQIYAPQGAPQQRAAPTYPNPAAAKAPTTVSNTLAQTRASVVDEDADWAALPFEERSARLFR